MVSKKLVQHLKLKVVTHPSPYKVGWIKRGGQVLVYETCTVPLSIGNHYRDQIICDVLDMDACRILLGRPWQYDSHTIYRGSVNIYEFEWMGKNGGPFTH